MDDQTKAFLAKLQRTHLKIWREDSPLAGEPYTVMHIESVFDLLELIGEWAERHGEGNTLNLLTLLTTDLMQMIGRDNAS